MKTAVYCLRVRVTRKVGGFLFFSYNDKMTGYHGRLITCSTRPCRASARRGKNYQVYIHKLKHREKLVKNPVVVFLLLLDL